MCDLSFYNIRRWLIGKHYYWAYLVLKVRFPCDNVKIRREAQRLLKNSNFSQFISFRNRDRFLVDIDGNDRIINIIDI
jgi:hypothetical protein